ncbi:uncharacterized protein LOC143238005 isoform X1 [Tachypleus tridentatus]|uniref:uncharacterized protein LOC143238005 isoform X1 n=2 Tax=Tachypleus tridentatus TaxID=6853 RepID=UPI003FCFC6B1
MRKIVETQKEEPVKVKVESVGDISVDNMSSHLIESNEDCDDPHVQEDHCSRANNLRKHITEEVEPLEIIRGSWKSVCVSVHENIVKKSTASKPEFKNQEIRSNKNHTHLMFLKNVTQNKIAEEENSKNYEGASYVLSESHVYTEFIESEREIDELSENLKKNQNSNNEISKAWEQRKSDLKIYSCSKCRKTFSRWLLLMQHKNSHENTEINKKHKCHLCSYSSNRSSSVNRHMVIHTGERRYSCDTCGKRFTQKESLRQHQRTHTKDKPFSCDMCGKKFKQKGSIKKHQLIHTGDIHYVRRFRCDVCGKKFTQDYLRKHQMAHAGEKPFSCDVCGKSFTYVVSLKRHSLIHTGEKELSCNICGRMFSLNAGLKQHQLIHTGHKPYVCDTCGKRFTRSHHLKRHQFVHTGERPFKCDICGKRFSLDSNLRQHQLIHTGQKPFGCDICGERFRISGYLKRHQLVHTGERPFSCHICGKRYKESSTLRKHSFHHSENISLSCVICKKSFNKTEELSKHCAVHIKPSSETVNA